MRLIMFVALCLPFFASAQTEDAAGIFRELRALDGTWFMSTDRGDRLEVWRIADDSTLTGSGLRIKPENGDTVTLETMRLELRNDSITYYTIARGQNQNRPIGFGLTQADYDGYVFENPAHDDPKKITYLLLGNRELQVLTVGLRNGRENKQEFIFEREFNPGAVEFRLRAGGNIHTLRGKGQFPPDTLFQEQSLHFGYQPGWEIGAQVGFEGRGGLLSVQVDFALTGKFSKVAANFRGDTSVYVRDGTYNTTWLTIGVQPELHFGREGRLSIFAGPYLGFLLGSRLKGIQQPTTENKLFKANNDFKKTDFGLVAGLQYRLNPGKKNLDGRVGFRFQLGLKNLDNFYHRNCDNPAFCNGQVNLQGFSVYYSVNLLKL